MLLLFFVLLEKRHVTCPFYIWQLFSLPAEPPWKPLQMEADTKSVLLSSSSMGWRDRSGWEKRHQFLPGLVLDSILVSSWFCRLLWRSQYFQDQSPQTKHWNILNHNMYPPANVIPKHASFYIHFFFLFFLTTSCGMQSLSSPNRDRTHAPCVRNMES